MEIINQLILQLQTVFTGIVNTLNWNYIFVFWLTAAVFNTYTEADGKAKFLDKFRSIPIVIRTLILGIIVILFFVFGYGVKDVATLIISMLVAMLSWRALGIKGIWNLIKKYILKIDSSTQK